MKKNPTESAVKRVSPIPLCVGYSMTGEGQMPFPEIVSRYRESIGEVYFAFTGMASGRSPLGDESGYTDFDATERLIDEIGAIADMGVKLDLLLNAACNGDDALSLAHERRVVSVLEYLAYKDCAPAVVTTTSPVTAEIVHRFDRNIDVRASVNMRIGTIKGVQYVEHLFDSFCICRDINRDLQALTELSEYLRKNGKGVSMLVNSGCLRNCSMQTFHDNAVAHEAGILSKANIPWAGASACRGYFSKSENRHAFLQNTWIRPEDLHHYVGLTDCAKLATRMHALPAMVIDAYARQSFHGNLADLFEPGHGPLFAPRVIDNDRFPEDWYERTTSCDKNCTKCSYCESVWKKVFVSGE
ncbi:MAG: hypothetical protein E7463_02455 [Ruminococcaceae bacterium]|nr:hypothetical protein [Oscillospiraceae bacterium]